MPEPLHILLVTDRKPGHENQLLALAARLAELTPAVVHEIDVSPAGALRRLLITPALPPTARSPDLILCAGRATHRPALKLARRHRAGLVCSMRPSLGRSRFDLCLIPRHDHPPPAPNLELTTRAIVNARPSAEHDPARGVILIGGPSRHHAVDESDLLSRIQQIAERSPEIEWELTTSRRTPASLERALAALSLSNLTVAPAAETPRGWVPDRLARAGSAWITEDSVSMICEALTAGAAVGLLPMRRAGASRVAAGVDDLLDRGLAVSHDAWLAGAPLAPPDEPLDEAARCARVILERLLPERAP